MNEPEGGLGSPRPIQSYAPRQGDIEPAMQDAGTVQAVERHLSRYVGKVSFVFHEIVSDIVHIDLHLVPPSADRPYHTLMTSGMSNRPMTVPSGFEHLRFAELMLCLPAEWPLRMEDLSNHAYYWPLEWLKRLARFPHEYKTGLGPGHTARNGNPATPYDPTTKLCCALMARPRLFRSGFDTIDVGPGRRINVMAFVPIHQDEVEFAAKHGSNKLTDRLNAAGVTELLRVDRPSTCPAKRFGLF